MRTSGERVSACRANIGASQVGLSSFPFGRVIGQGITVRPTRFPLPIGQAQHTCGFATERVSLEQVMFGIKPSRPKISTATILNAFLMKADLL